MPPTGRDNREEEVTNVALGKSLILIEAVIYMESSFKIQTGFLSTAYLVGIKSYKFWINDQFLSHTLTKNLWLYTCLLYVCSALILPFCV